MHARGFLATPNLGKDMARELNKALAYMWELADIAEAAEVRIAELEAGEISALREARAETWDEAISAVFAWWSAPPEQRPAGIVNPYGIGLPVESEGE